MAEVLAPLAGNIWKVTTKVGAAVEEDEEVVIIEAMKMETPVYAPCDGTVSAINIKEGDTVEEDDLLLVID